MLLVLVGGYGSAENVRAGEMAAEPTRGESTLKPAVGNRIRVFISFILYMIICAYVVWDLE